MTGLVLLAVVAASPGSPPQLPGRVELAVHDAFAFTPACPVKKLVSAPRSVSVSLDRGRVLIRGEVAGGGAITLLCLEALPAESEPIGSDKARISCPAGAKPDVYEKVNGERVSSCLVERSISVSVDVLPLPPRSRTLVLVGPSGEATATNVLFAGEARAFWPSCRISRLAVSDDSASIDPGEGGSMVLRAHGQGTGTQLAFCHPTGRLAIPVTVLP